MLNKARHWKEYIRIFLFIALIISIIYAIVNIITSPLEVDTAELEYHEMLKGDYVLILTQCILGLLVMMIPAFIEERKGIDIPDILEIIYFVFLFLAIVLGEVRNFYYLIPHWDTILHSFSGLMLGALGFYLVTLLNNIKRVDIYLTPFFVAFFSFCFALTAGTMWEIYEFLMDGLLSLNMQKYMMEDGMKLIGRAALFDTMKDIIVDTISALFVCILGYFSIKKKGFIPGFKTRDKKNGRGGRT